MTSTNEIPATWTKVRLVEPASSGFLYVGASSGAWRLPVLLPSSRRRTLLSRLHQCADELLLDPRVVRADIFRAVLRPPGTLENTAGEDVPPASFDAVMLVETTTPGTAASIAAEAPIMSLHSSLGSPLILAGRNPRRIGSVEHTRQGVFLFNYFSAPDVSSNLRAWQYTAGWFQDETGLDNSTVIEPFAGASSPYALINHCRWDHYRDVLPSLVFKRSFHTFVLRVFEEHAVVPRPILYRLHKTDGQRERISNGRALLAAITGKPSEVDGT